MAVQRPAQWMSFSIWLLAAAGSAALALCATAETDAPAPALVYEVASVRPHPADATIDRSWGTIPDGLEARNITVRTLIVSAHGPRIDDQLIGLPKWANTDAFDIQAKMNEDAIAACHKLDRQEAAKQRRLMLQKLLADRFQLKVHHQTEQLPIYNLMVAKGGPKLKQAAADAGGGVSWGNRKLTGNRVEITGLTNALSDILNRVVIDKTGLTRQYTITLKWTPDDKQETTDSGPSILQRLKSSLD